MQKNETGPKLAEIALSQVGIKEIGGNNRGPDIVKFQKATWLEPGPWPWCAAFVCWVILRLLNTVAGAKEALKIADIEKWRPRTAGAFDFKNWAKKNGIQILGEQEAVKAGDIVIFDFSHIGFIVEDAAARSQFIKTAEGNTNGKGERDSESGDGVWAKTRARSLAQCFLRIGG